MKIKILSSLVFRNKDFYCDQGHLLEDNSIMKKLYFIFFGSKQVW